MVYYPDSALDAVAHTLQAYATTFNSSQGLTLDRTVLDLRQGAFAHRQLYAALIRIR
jgi:hypothetical protein